MRGLRFGAAAIRTFALGSWTGEAPNAGLPALRVRVEAAHGHGKDGGPGRAIVCNPLASAFLTQAAKYGSCTSPVPRGPGAPGDRHCGQSRPWAWPLGPCDDLGSYSHGLWGIQWPQVRPLLSHLFFFFLHCRAHVQCITTHGPGPCVWAMLGARVRLSQRLSTLTTSRQ